MAVCWITVFWRLGYLPLLDPDEAHYAQITREMIGSHEWLVPLLDGRPYIDKPVLFHWLQAASFLLLGGTEFAARLPSALSAISLLAMTWWCGRRLFGPPVGERAALLLATTPAMFALSSIAIFDMLFTVCLFGALACFAVATGSDRPRLQYAGFVLVAAAVLTKGPIAVVLLTITACLCVLHPATRASVFRLRWLHGLMIVVGLAGPWFLWMWYRFGHEFVNRYVFYNNLLLFGSPLYRRRRYPLFYGRVFLTAFLPWSPILVGWVIDLARNLRRVRELSSGEVVLGAWIVTVIGFFSLSWFKLDTYIFPSAPAVCLLASAAWQRERAADTSTSATRISLAAIAVLLPIAGVVLWSQMDKLNLPFSRGAVALPVSLIVAGGAFGWQLVRRRLRPPVWGAALLVPLLCGYAAVVVYGFPVLHQTKPTPPIAKWVVQHSAPDDALALYRLERWHASLRFYANRPVSTLQTSEEVRRFFAENPRGLCVMAREHYEALVAEGLSLELRYRRKAVLGNEGRGLRRQRWGDVIVAAPPTHPQPAPPGGPVGNGS
jgi:4-amino-4-deoxy-L-arabinose transferase-like glycosyltransferase